MKRSDPALLIQAEDQPGVLFELTRVIAAHQANISYIDIVGRLPEHAYSESFADRFFFEIVQRVGDYDGYGALNAAARLASQSQANAAA